jgi:hypothetical protein
MHSLTARLAIAIGLAALSTPALAQSEDQAPEAKPVSAARAADAVLPMTVSPRVSDERGAVMVTSGYDGAQRSPTLSGAADVRVAGPVALRAGFTYVPEAVTDTFKPHFGLRVQLLQQNRHGIDGAVGVFYRMERYIQDEGLLQVAALVGRRVGRLGLYGNASYGQDPEGDDRDGEVKLAALYELSSTVHAGIDGRLRFDLFSSDSRRAARGASGLDFAVGPLASVSLGRMALIGQVGASGVRVMKLETGLLAAVGVASLF